LLFSLVETICFHFASSPRRFLEEESHKKVAGEEEEEEEEEEEKEFGIIKMDRSHL
jgi:hypothetical protein